MTMADFIATIPACKGLVPTKDDFELYCNRYSTPGYSLKSMLTGFNCKGLKVSEIEAVAKRYGKRGLYGTIEEIVEKERIFINFSIQDGLRLLEWHMRNDTDIEEKRKNYEKLRSFVGLIIGQIIRYEYYKMQLNNMTEQEKYNERHSAQMETEEYRKWREAREKVFPLIDNDPDFFVNIDQYQLSNFEREVAVRYSSPLIEGWTRKYYRPIPVQSIKMAIIRKIFKLNIRDFAKKIGFKNVNKYSSVVENGVCNNEYIDIAEVFNWEFIWKVCKATGVNPYWLSALTEDSISAYDENEIAHSIEDAIVYETWDTPLYADKEIVRYWALEQYLLSDAGQEVVSTLVSNIGEDTTRKFIGNLDKIIQ